MEPSRENKQISNRFYNLAINRALDRDLFGATLLLKKALLFNSKNANARNLLGLIFFEEGSVTEALVEWLISKELVHTDFNVANEYLSKVQNDERLNDYFESIKLYNAAIDDISFERNDLAMIKLYKSIEKNDHNMKAMMLLSTLLLQINDHIKAGHFLLRCQKIDNGNTFINEHMDYVLKNTKRNEVKEKRIQNVYSLKKLDTDDAILPRKYIKLSENQKVIFILIGIIIGALFYALILSPHGGGNSYASDSEGIIIGALFYSLVLSPHRSTNSYANDNEVIKYANLVNDQNKIIRDITIENNELKKNYEDASVKLHAYEEQDKLFTSQYESLNSIITDFDSGYISRAAKTYVELDKEAITDDALITLLNQAKSRIEGIGAKRLTELGTENWNAGNRSSAISYYQLSLNINPDDPETMFLLARLYQSFDRNTEANQLFDKIIALHPESSYARRSREARGY